MIGCWCVRVGFLDYLGEINILILIKILFVGENSPGLKKKEKKLSGRRLVNIIYRMFSHIYTTLNFEFFSTDSKPYLQTSHIYLQEPDLQQN